MLGKIEDKFDFERSLKPEEAYKLLIDVAKRTASDKLDMHMGNRLMYTDGQISLTDENKGFIAKGNIALQVSLFGGTKQFYGVEIRELDDTVSERERPFLQKYAHEVMNALRYLNWKEHTL